MRKILIIGPTGCGESTLTKKYLYTDGIDSTYYRGCQFIEHGGSFTFDVEKIQPYLDKSDAVIIMYDVTSRVHFKNVSFWAKLIAARALSIPVLLVGNKIDLKRKVESRKALENGWDYLKVSVRQECTLAGLIRWAGVIEANL